jgi:2-hydroxychromene-2-carboxylate isomerase
LASYPQPIFYYDLGSPECYLAGERIMSALPVVPAWEPVLASHFGGIDSKPDQISIYERSEDLQLQRFRWPRVWPPDTRQAMLAATFAKRIGRVVAFSLAAFRQAFAAGRDLGDVDTLLIAAAACEIHPTALHIAIGLRATADALDNAIGHARADRVTSLPAIAVDGGVFQGPECVEEAADLLESGR